MGKALSFRKTAYLGQRKPKVADEFGVSNRYFLLWKAEVVA